MCHIYLCCSPLCACWLICKCVIWWACFNWYIYYNRMWNKCCSSLFFGQFGLPNLVYGSHYLCVCTTLYITVFNAHASYVTHIYIYIPVRYADPVLGIYAQWLTELVQLGCIVIVFCVHCYSSHSWCQWVQYLHTYWHSSPVDAQQVICKHGMHVPKFA